MKHPPHKALVLPPVFLGLMLAVNSEFSGARAQNTVFTYQGQVLDNGAPFTGTGQFQFALVTSTNASSTATATADAPSGGYITGYNVTFGGNGYLIAPAVTVIGGGGTGATATAHLTGGSVTSITVTSTGNGNYTNTPTVIIAPPPPDISYATFWSNDGTSTNGSEPALAVAVPVTNGLFTVTLGDATQPGMAAIGASLFFQPNLQLRIWFNDGTHGFAAVNPAQNLTPTPYATVANTAVNLDNGLIIQNNTNGSPDIIGGYLANFVSSGIYGGTIAGGGQVNFSNSVTADFGTVGGGGDNIASGWASTVGGGAGNTASSVGGSATVAGGYENTASGNSSIVGGGDNNTASTYASTVAGGSDNTANGPDGNATVAGGQGNIASGDGAAIAGGIGNTASGANSTVGGGYNNNAGGQESTVPGGIGNYAGADYSFAGGYYAQAVNDYSFVWSSSGPFSSTANGQFAVRADGGILFAGDVQLAGGIESYHNLSLSGGNSTGYLYASYPGLGDGIHLGYNFYYDNIGLPHIPNAGGGTSRLSLQYGQITLAVGGANLAPTNRLIATTAGVTVYGTFNNSSDRNAKQDFASVSPAQILEKVNQLPITEWSYKIDPMTRHVGPMGQDFYATFNIGTDEKHIAPIDEGGVALAAIQGLNNKVEEDNAELRAENADLKKQLDALESLVREIAQKESK